MWVLTGDKTETAVDIAHSCCLFSSQTELAHITGATCSSEARTLLGNARKILESSSDNGMVLDGRSLKFLLEDQADQLFDLGLRSRACVCSRLSPSQKRQLIELVRARSPSITLAIGDGANDVPMILGAHVGIGIRGKEGSQAVQASDVAISQFRFLLPLLLCHGRRAYRRIATFLCYYLYKNVTLAWGDLIWAHQDGFNGVVAYPEWLSTSFNAIFTSWPVLIVLALDSDIPDATALSNPGVYIEGIRQDWFSPSLFSLWMLSGAWHGSLAWVLPSISFGSASYDTVEFWRASTTAFTIVINVLTLKLYLHSFSRCSVSCWAPLIGSIALYIVCLFLLGYVSLGQRMQPNLSEGGDPPVPGWIFSNPLPLVQILVVPLFAILPDMACLIWTRRLHPSPLFQVGRKVGFESELLT